MSTTVDQSQASAGNDIVAGDKVVHNNNILPTLRNPSVVEKLLEKLHSEIGKNQIVLHTIESLSFFYEKRALDGIVGLEAKLKHAGKESEIWLALEKKEHFVKLLEKWSMYMSAQEIFAYLLARAEYEYNTFILPQINSVSLDAYNEMIRDKIVIPTIDECGSSVFTLNHTLVMGMLYWLAEQCYVRWHI